MKAAIAYTLVIFGVTQLIGIWIGSAIDLDANASEEQRANRIRLTERLLRGLSDAESTACPGETDAAAEGLTLWRATGHHCKHRAVKTDLA